MMMRRTYYYPSDFGDDDTLRGCGDMWVLSFSFGIVVAPCQGIIWFLAIMNPFYLYLSIFHSSSGSLSHGHRSRPWTSKLLALNTQYSNLFDPPMPIETRMAMHGPCVCKRKNTYRFIYIFIKTTFRSTHTNYNYYSYFFNFSTVELIAFLLLFFSHFYYLFIFVVLNDLVYVSDDESIWQADACGSSKTRTKTPRPWLPSLDCC